MGIAYTIPKMNEAWIALIGTVFGGAGFKIIEYFLGRRGRREDFATKLRGELRDEITELRKEADKLQHECDKLRDEIDEWRTKYYALVAAVARGDVSDALKKIDKERKK